MNEGYESRSRSSEIVNGSNLRSNEFGANSSGSRAIERSQSRGKTFDSGPNRFKEGHFDSEQSKTHGIVSEDFKHTYYGNKNRRNPSPRSNFPERKIKSVIVRPNSPVQRQKRTSIDEHHRRWTPPKARRSEIAEKKAKRSGHEALRHKIQRQQVVPAAPEAKPVPPTQRSVDLNDSVVIHNDIYRPRLAEPRPTVATAVPAEPIRAVPSPAGQAAAPAQQAEPIFAAFAQVLQPAIDQGRPIEFHAHVHYHQGGQRVNLLSQTNYKKYKDLSKNLKQGDKKRLLKQIRRSQAQH